MYIYIYILLNSWLAYPAAHSYLPALEEGFDKCIHTYVLPFKEAGFKLKE